MECLEAKQLLTTDLGAKFGNPIAKTISVNENPFAKMCNQIMLEVMGRQMNPEGSQEVVKED